jgi:hypothetical protein
MNKTETLKNVKEMQKEHFMIRTKELYDGLIHLNEEYVKKKLNEESKDKPMPHFPVQTYSKSKNSFIMVDPGTTNHDVELFQQRMLLALELQRKKDELQLLYDNKIRAFNLQCEEYCLLLM